MDAGHRGPVDGLAEAVREHPPDRDRRATRRQAGRPARELLEAIGGEFNERERERRISMFAGCLPIYRTDDLKFPTCILTNRLQDLGVDMEKISVPDEAFDADSWLKVRAADDGVGSPPLGLSWPVTCETRLKFKRVDRDLDIWPVWKPSPEIASVTS